MSEKKTKPRGLGRGLSALMSDVNADSTTSSGAQVARRSDLDIPIEQLSANPNQPRRTFNQDDLDDLAASIREKGILQPLIVRQLGPAHYEIVAGERRWRAAQMAQLHQVPVLVRDYNDTEVLEIAIIENIQRADLNAVEEAAGYRQLMDGFGHTQEKLAEALGKSRSHIANFLRLLNLPDDVLYLVRQGKLSAGHARALIPAENPSELARIVVDRGLSVRETEALVKSHKPGTPGGASKPRKSAGGDKDADTKALEQDLSAALGMQVSIGHVAGTETGQLTISYKSLDDLDTICGMLSRSIL